jgi:hypothetical protein
MENHCYYHTLYWASPHCLEVIKFGYDHMLPECVNICLKVVKVQPNSEFCIFCRKQDRKYAFRKAVDIIPNGIFLRFFKFICDPFIYLYFK